MLLPLFPLETREFLPLLETPCSVRCLAPVLSASSSYSAAADRHPGGKSRAQPSCAWSPPQPWVRFCAWASLCSIWRKHRGKSQRQQAETFMFSESACPCTQTNTWVHTQTHTHSDKSPPNYLLQEKQILCFCFLKTFSVEDLCHMISINTVRL